MPGRLRFVFDKETHRNVVFFLKKKAHQDTPPSCVLPRETAWQAGSERQAAAHSASLRAGLGWDLWRVCCTVTVGTLYLFEKKQEQTLITCSIKKIKVEREKS